MSEFSAPETSRGERIQARWDAINRAIDYLKTTPQNKVIAQLAKTNFRDEFKEDPGLLVDYLSNTQEGATFIPWRIATSVLKATGLLVECPQCQGVGRRWGHGEQCPACEGTRWVKA